MICICGMCLQTSVDHDLYMCLQTYVDHDLYMCLQKSVDHNLYTCLQILDKKYFLLRSS